MRLRWWEQHGGGGRNREHEPICSTTAGEPQVVIELPFKSLRLALGDLPPRHRGHDNGTGQADECGPRMPSARPRSNANGTGIWPNEQYNAQGFNVLNLDETGHAYRRRKSGDYPESASELASGRKDASIPLRLRYRATNHGFAGRRSC